MNKHASALGKLAKGKPKNYSAAEIKRRTAILDKINKSKRIELEKLTPRTTKRKGR